MKRNFVIIEQFSIRVHWTKFSNLFNPQFNTLST